MAGSSTGRPVTADPLGPAMQRLAALPDSGEFAGTAARTGLPWHPMSLADGFSGVALLFGALGRPADAHRQLAAAIAAKRPPTEGLFDGLPSVAFAARFLARSCGGYAGLLRRLDPLVADVAERRIAEESRRLDEHRPGAPMRAYDAAFGLAGIGRYLLAAGEDQRPALEHTLRYLVRLTESVTVRGKPVPGWFTTDPTTLATPVEHPDGHLNLGLAHGVAGPLAMLALAYRAGYRVGGHAEAIHRITAWLLARRGTDRHGPYWPAVVPLAHELAATVAGLAPARVAWCYGAPGIGRAVQLAALALGEPAWTAEAVGTLTAALRRPWEHSGIRDAGLCHGSAGVLTATALIAEATADAELHERLAALRAHATQGAVPGERLGLLDGLTGTVLALRATVDPVTEPAWPAALLLA
jgi:hypothetical protein